MSSFQNRTSQEQSLYVQFETLLNSTSEWQNNPIEATRQCFLTLFSLLKSTSSTLMQLEHTKASKNELSSSLNIKANIADIMRTFSEVAQNIESRPTLNEVNILLDDKVSKHELSVLLSTKPSVNDIKHLLQSEEIQLNINNNINELSQHFVTQEQLASSLNQTVSKDNLLVLMDQKVSRDEMEQLLAHKVNVNELKAMLDEVNDKIHNNTVTNLTEESIVNINKRIDEMDKDIDILIDNIKKQFQNVNNVINNLTSTKADYKEVEMLIKNGSSQQVEQMLMQTKTELTDNITKSRNDFIQAMNVLEQQFKGDILHNEKEYNEKLTKLSKEFTQGLTYVNNDIGKLNNNIITKNEVEDMINKKIYSSNAVRHIEESSSKAQQHISNDDLDSLYQSVSKHTHDRIEESKHYIQEYIKQFNNSIQEQLDTKASISEMHVLLSSKADHNKTAVILDNKTPRCEFEALKLTVEKLSNDMISKLDQSKFDMYVQHTTNTIDTMSKDVMMKANINEMMSYVKSKVSIDEVNKALSVIHDELDTKLTVDEFQTAMNNQNAINDILCKENIVGKWLWNSGTVKKGYIVPWETEHINTSPENFVWDKESTSILVNEKGIYVIGLSFFVSGQPNVQVYINGESVLSVGESCKGVVRFNKEMKEQYGGNEEEISGCTMMEYINLESKSRVSVSYNGNYNVKGFLSLQKV